MMNWMRKRLIGARRWWRPREPKPDPKSPFGKLVGKPGDDRPFVTFMRGGERFFMDRMSFEYEHGRRVGHDPLPRELDRAIALADRVRLIAGGIYRDDPIGCEILLDSMDPLLLAELRAAFAPKDDPAGFLHCQGLDALTFEFTSGDKRLAVVAVYQGRFIRWPRWRHDVELNDAAALQGILGRLGIRFSDEPAENVLYKTMSMMSLSQAERHAYRAESYRARGAVARALDECEQALSRDARSWLALRVRAVLLHQEGHLDKADEAFSRSLEAGAPPSETFRMRALVRSMQGRHQDALDDCEAAEKSGQGHADILMTRGMVLVKMNRLDEARSALDQAEKLSGDASIVLWNRAMMEFECGNNAAAVEALDRLVIALRARGHKPTPAATDAVHREIDLNLCSVYLQRARAQANLNRHEKAFYNFARAEKEDPNNLLTYEWRASLRLQRDEFGLALRDCDRLVRLAPCDEVSYSFRANARMESGDVDGALEDLETALRFAAEPHRIHGLRGQILLGAGRVGDARAEFDELLAIKPDEAPALFLRSQCWRHLGIHEEQRADLHAALALDPDNPIVLNSLSWLYSTCTDEDLRDGEQAVALAQRAVSAARELNPHYLDTLAAGFAEAGRFVEACQAMRRAIAVFKTFLPAPGLEPYRQRLALYEGDEPYRES